MTLRIIEGKDHSKNSFLLQSYYALRHNIFISKRGWSLPSFGNMEIDEYDDGEAIYFLDVNCQGVIQASVRITPSVTSSLTADYFPHLIENGSTGRDNHIYEATRFIIKPQSKCRKDRKLLKVNLLKCLAKWCVKNNVIALQTIIDAGTLSSYLQLNPWIKPLGLAHAYGGGKGVLGGGECMAIHWPANEEVIDFLSKHENKDKTKIMRPVPQVIKNQTTEAHVLN
ncbi:MAG: acyl-homoserine-lactone synthase [Pseudomonadota bacterium]